MKDLIAYFLRLILAVLIIAATIWFGLVNVLHLNIRLGEVSYLCLLAFYIKDIFFGDEDYNVLTLAIVSVAVLGFSYLFTFL